MPTDTPLLDLLRLREDTARPVYQQLSEQLTELIRLGRIEPGSTLPAERYLAERLGVSRGTVQRSYRELRERALIEPHGRRGFIVRGVPRINPGMDRLKGFTDEMRELGVEPSSRVVVREVTHDRSIASLFGRPSHAPLLKLVRVRYGDGIPMSYEVAWYDLTLLPDLAQADLSGSVYAWIADRGLRLAYCEQTVEAAQPSRIEAEVFGFDAPVPCLLIKRRSYTRYDQMLEYVEGLFRGDLYTYRLRLSA